MTSTIILGVMLLGSLLAVVCWLIARALGYDRVWRWRISRSEFDRAAAAIARQLAWSTRRLSGLQVAMARRYVHLRAPSELIAALEEPGELARFHLRINQIAVDLATTRHLNPMQRIRGQALLVGLDYQILTRLPGELHVAVTKAAIDPLANPRIELVENQIETETIFHEEDETFVLPSAPTPRTGLITVKRPSKGERAVVPAGDQVHLDHGGWVRRSAHSAVVTIEFRANGQSGALQAQVSAQAAGVRVDNQELPAGQSLLVSLPTVVNLRSARLALASAH